MFSAVEFNVELAVHQSEIHLDPTAVLLPFQAPDPSAFAQMLPERFLQDGIATTWFASTRRKLRPNGLCLFLRCDLAFVANLALRFPARNEVVPWSNSEYLAANRARFPLSLRAHLPRISDLRALVTTEPSFRPAGAPLIRCSFKEAPAVFTVLGRIVVEPWCSHQPTMLPQRSDGRSNQVTAQLTAAVKVYPANAATAFSTIVWPTK
jgi:hypothetical protein